MKGRVKWWCEDKKYGFIEYNDNQDIFAHLEENSENPYVKENQEIEFTIEEKNNCTYLHILKVLEN